jgi:hypothetical protein
MRLIRYTTDETPRVGVAVGEAIHPVEGTIAELLRLTAADMTARLQEAVRATDTVAMSDVRLLAPVDGWTEVWAAGVTYKRSREARMAESDLSADVYERVYDAERPEFFLQGPRVAGAGSGRGHRCAHRHRHHRAGARTRPGRQRVGRRGRLHHLQRRQLARHRGREPSLPAAGEGLQRVVRARPGDRHRRRDPGPEGTAAGGPDRAGRVRRLAGRSVDGRPGARARGPGRLPAARAPPPLRGGAVDRYLPGAGPAVHPDRGRRGTHLGGADR